MNLPRMPDISAHIQITTSAGCHLSSASYWSFLLWRVRRAPASSSNISAAAATRTRRLGSELAHAGAQYSNHELGGAVHGPLRHASPANIVCRLQRHFESEAFAPPNLKFADRLSLCDRRRYRHSLDR